MGMIRKTGPVKLIIGLLAASEDLMREAEERVIERWGAVDHASPVIPFSFTDYYEREMGAGLLRRWISFRRLIQPDRLAAIKVATNDIEALFLREGGRRVNIDPGYLALPRLVLASTKDFGHRIYLADGIYGEVTLIYQHHRFQALPWSYPDYLSEPALAFLTTVRETYQLQLTENLE